MAIGQFEENVQDFESRTAADKNVYVKFYLRPIPDEEKSAAEGRPIYKDKEYVEIRTPGQQNNIIQRPVTDMDRQRFRGAYQAFKSGQEEQTIGTPLAEQGWITRSQVEELAHLRVRTVEHLASLDDGVCSRYAGMYGLKQKAQQIIAQSEKNAPFSQMQKDKAELEAKLAALQEVVKDQSEIIKGLQAAKAK